MQQEAVCSPDRPTHALLPLPPPTPPTHHTHTPLRRAHTQAHTFLSCGLLQRVGLSSCICICSKRLLSGVKQALLGLLHDVPDSKVSRGGTGLRCQVCPLPSYLHRCLRRSSWVRPSSPAPRRYAANRSTGRCYQPVHSPAACPT